MENTSDTGLKSFKSRSSVSFSSKSKSLKELKKKISNFNMLQKKSKLHLNSGFLKLKRSKIVNNKKYHLEILKKYTSRKPELSSLPKQLINSDLFKSYETSLVLTHEKGKTLIQNFLYSKKPQFAQSSISVEKYHSLYNLIKKSKHKLFSQDQLEDIELNIVGSFLAKDFDYKNHSIIIILSRNSFLPSTNIELNDFEDLTTLLKPHIKMMLSQDLINAKNRICKTLLENFPIPISLESNSVHSQNIDLNQVIEEQKIDKDLYIRLHSNRDREKQYAYDIYHMHRINLLGELLNTLKHEISNPLFGVKLGADLLAYENLEKDSYSITQDIEQSCRRCQNIMSSFTYIYDQEDLFCNTNILKLVRETITLTKSETGQIAKEIIFDSTLDFEQFEISSNPTYLSQIIFNLIINASQAIQKKTRESLYEANQIIITLKKSYNYFEIIIRDSGPGIPDNIINKIFEPFFTTKSFGTGLGLSICKDLAKQIGGSLSCRNLQEKSGAEFTLKVLNKGNIND